MATRKCGVWLGILVLGGFLPAVLVKFGADAVIIKGPENITAPVGAIVTFHCLAQGDDAFWEINDTTIEYEEDRDPFMEKGFSFRDNSNVDTYNFTITVNAVPGNNNTRVMCLVYPLDDNNFPGSLTVIVPGPPPSPKLHLLVLNATTIQLSWLPPFSWAEYPIVNYSVQVYNRATGDVMNSFIDATSEMFSTTAPVIFIHNTPHGGVMRNCEELVFIVSAASIIGRGSPAIVTGGFPIAPTLDTVETTTAIVTYQFDGTPLLLLNMQVKPPEVCSFQKLGYTITIQQISPTLNTVSDAGGADDIIVIGPKTVMGHTNVYEVVNSEVVDTVYSVLVEFDTLAGNISSTTTFREHSHPTTDYPDINVTAGAGTHSQPATITESTNTTGAGTCLMEKIAIGVSISLVIIIASAIVLLMICGFIYRRHTSDKNSAEKPCDDTVPNPIYIGPQCKNIQPEFKSLTPPHPTADVMEPHYIERPTNQTVLSELAKSSGETAIAVAGGPLERSGDQKAKWAISDPGSSDKYIRMNPVGTLTSTLHGGWGDPNSELP